MGDGVEINVWTAPWLPSLDNGRVTTPYRYDLSRLLVSDLMYSNMKVWNEEKVNDIFNARDAGLILATPLRVRQVVDCWYWLSDKHGNYTVKSGYRELQIHTNDPEVGNIEPKLWKAVWSIKALPKMVNIMW